MTVGRALERYEEHQRRKGNKAGSIAHNLWRLRKWLDEDQAIADVTEGQMKKTYQERASHLAADSHRGELAVVKTFFNWAVAQELITRSPAEKVEPVGRRRRGKAQLRKGEAKAFAAKALLMAQGGDDGALAALAALILGLRSSELRLRQVRDVDESDEGVLLWVDAGKTEAARRFMEVPEPLAGLFLGLVGTRAKEDWLFPSAAAGTGHREATWLRKAVRRVCKAAGVPRVCPHGLRGTWATLTTDAGVAAHVVARELGHTNPSVTKEHYTERGADDRARTRKLHLVAG
ncbi:MAG TPA: site-specific integrase [Myxococcota bacterium]|nr:site-specific integrase [Myxococcota bacterium]HRY94746.1 site-specific integrase [Myxococcota bacterium]